MSLSNKDKEILHKAIIQMMQLIHDLEEAPADPRVMDLIEVCASMIEQQIEMNIFYEQCSHVISDEVLFFDGEVKEEQTAPITFTDDAPSSEDLAEWFNLDNH